MNTCISTPLITRHLDLGCGGIPRNPYLRKQVFGVDISPPKVANTEECTIVSGNLALQPIPFPDAYFDSVSAYDFLEHMPRVLSASNGTGLRFPFIELMNEISRVLNPGGRFYALTPAYPSEEAFVDPTHVNILTSQSHRYFVGKLPLGSMYGFKGQFKLLRSEKAVYRDSLDPLALPNLSQRWRRLRHQLKGKLNYLVWEFERCH